LPPKDLTGQLDALKAAGAEAIYREKVSGVRADRPQLAKLMAKLMPGDIVVVTKLDRLGRSTRELLELIERIGKAGASFRSRSMWTCIGNGSSAASPAASPGASHLFSSHSFVPTITLSFGTPAVWRCLKERIRPRENDDALPARRKERVTRLCIGFNDAFHAEGLCRANRYGALRRFSGRPYGAEHPSGI
jgi:hypothetical protein